jgi:hypothetical protein
MRKAFLATGLILPVLAACGSTTSGTTTPTASTASTPTAAPTAAPTAVPTPTPTLATAVPSSFDPCQIVTQSEASSLAGTTFGAGTEETNSGGGKTCVYGGQTLNVFSVIVGVATDAATAQAEWATEEANAKTLFTKALPSGVTLNYNISDTTITGADMAATASGTVTFSGQVINATAVYLLVGPVFVSFDDLTLGKSAPSVSDMTAEAANNVVGRM